MTEILAIYGALIGTVSIGWQIWNAIAQSRIKLELRVSLDVPPPEARETTDPNELALEVRVINPSDHTAHIVRAGFETDGGASATYVDGRVVGPIGARDSDEWYTNSAAWVDFTRGMVKPARAFVELTTGQRFYSREFRAYPGENGGMEGLS